MKDYCFVSPATLDECLGVLQQEDSNAIVIAGCTNILPSLKNKKLAKGVFVDINGIETLRGIKSDSQAIKIGAATTITQLLKSDIIKENATVLWEACQQFADPTVRNRATIGGNLVNASPAADAIVPLLALGASVSIAGRKDGIREVPLEQFLLGPGKTILGRDELLVAIIIPQQSGAKGKFIKFGLRQSMAISVISVAVNLNMNGPVCVNAQIALGAVAPTAIRARQTENYLIGQTLDAAVLSQAAELVKSEIQPIDDIRASRDYRTHLVGELLGRAMEEALAKEGSES